MPTIGVDSTGPKHHHRRGRRRATLSSELFIAASETATKFCIPDEVANYRQTGQNIRDGDRDTGTAVRKTVVSLRLQLGERPCHCVQHRAEHE